MTIAINLDKRLLKADKRVCSDFSHARTILLSEWITFSKGICFFIDFQITKSNESKCENTSSVFCQLEKRLSNFTQGEYYSIRAVLTKA